MVTHAYLNEKPPSGPSKGKLFVDQTALPAMIDVAGATEVALERLAASARAAPVPMFLLALFLGTAIGRWMATARK